MVCTLAWNWIWWYLWISHTFLTLPLKAQGPDTKANAHRTHSHSGEVMNPWQSRLWALPALLTCLWLLFVNPVDPLYEEPCEELGPDRQRRSSLSQCSASAGCLCSHQAMTEPAERGHHFPVKPLGNTGGKGDAPPALLLGKMSVSVCISLKGKNCKQKPQICRKDSLHKSRRLILCLCFGHL